MKILVDGLPANCGGIGTLIINLITFNKYKANGDKILFEFLVPIGSEYIEFLKNEEYCYYEVPRIFSKHYKSKIKWIFENNKYDYVWINNTSKVNITLPRIAKKNNAIVITHSHGVASEATGVKSFLFSIFEFIYGKEFCSYIDIPFACSELSADFFYPKDLRQKCKIVANGIEIKKFIFNVFNRSDCRKKLGFNDDDIVMGAVGRLTKVKNYEFIINLMPQLPKNYKLIILGDGEDKSKLKDLISVNKLIDRVLLLGKQNNVEYFLSGMDIYLMPSLNEGLPFSLVEAQANGLKCLVSTGVSEEAKIIELVEFINLQNIEHWIESIMSDLPNESIRLDANRIISEAGYSIENSYEIFMNELKR